MTSSLRHVIVIDDDPSVRRSLKRRLSTEGHAVEAFSSAREYLETGAPVPATCMVLDVRMPGLNGLERQEKDAARQQSLALLDTLTERELEVFRWIIAGSLNKQTAAGLGTSEKTIKVHRGHITGKLGILAVADMGRLAQQAGVTPVSVQGEREDLAS